MDRAERVSVRRLAVGKLTPAGTLRMTAPHSELAGIAVAAGRFRAAGLEVTVSANPGTLNHLDGTSADHGLRIIVRRERH